jgi:Ras-related C3 botulinum toxin substrate 1
MMKNDVKLVVVGDTGVGKTSLIYCYTTNAFVGDAIPSVLDYYEANVMVDNQKLKMSLWDTLGINYQPPLNKKWI